MHPRFVVFLCFLAVLALPAFAQNRRTWRAYVEPALARLLFKDTAGTIALYNRIVAASGDSADAYMLRGLMYSSIRRFDAALTDLDVAIGKDSNNYQYWLVRGLVCMDAHRYPQAAKNFSYCTVLDTEREEAYHYRGLVALRLRDYESAVLDFADVVRLDSSNVDAMLQSATANVMTGRSKAALRDINRAIELDSTFAQAYMVRAGLLIDAGKSTEACDDLKRAIKFGYKPALEMARTQCQQHISSIAFDSLRTYVLEEITVVGERDKYKQAAQEMKFIAKRSQILLASLESKVSGRMRPRRISSFGGGRTSMLFQRPVVVGAGALQPTSLAAVESQRSSATNLDDMIYLTRERVEVSNNEEALKKLQTILTKRSAIAMMVQSGNTVAVRGNIQDVVSLIQDIADILNHNNN